MSKMLQLVEQMQARLNEISASEQALLRGLRDALNRVDDKLMQDVRTISAEHENRRRAVLDELQGLASRLGAFPAAREPAPELGHGLEHGDDGARPHELIDEGRRHTPAPSQKRRTVGNITAELDHYFKARAS